MSLVFSHIPKNSRFAGRIPIPKTSVENLYGPLVKSVWSFGNFVSGYKFAAKMLSPVEKIVYQLFLTVANKPN